MQPVIRNKFTCIVQTYHIILVGPLLVCWTCSSANSTIQTRQSHINEESVRKINNTGAFRLFAYAHLIISPISTTGLSTAKYQPNTNISFTALYLYKLPQNSSFTKKFNTAMGNCLALQGKFLQVMKTDGKILEYTAPLKVHQVLSEYPGHAISQTLPVTQHLPLDTNMHAGHVYYLIPVPSLELDKKHYSNTKEVAEKENHGVVRIKLLIRKQDLEMLSQGGSIEELIWQLQNKRLVHSFKNLDSDAGKNSRGWNPILPSIPEAC